MPPLQDQIVQQILEAAAESDLGIEVLIQDPSGEMVQKTRRAKTLIYAGARQDPRFADFKIYLHPSDPENRLWIFKTEPKSESEEPFDPLGPIKITLDD